MTFRALNFLRWSRAVISFGTFDRFEGALEIVAGAGERALQAATESWDARDGPGRFVGGIEVWSVEARHDSGWRAFEGERNGRIVSRKA